MTADKAPSPEQTSTAAAPGFDSPPDSRDPAGSGERPAKLPTSPWSIGAICSLPILCCPLASVLAVGLGLMALRDIRLYAGRRGGARLAKIAILVGGFLTAGWIGGAMWWNANIRIPLREGPAEAMRLGSAGDVTGFRTAFYDRSAPRTDEEAAAFLSIVATRYGRLIESHQDESREMRGTVGSPGGLIIPYKFVFERGTVDGLGRFIVIEGGWTGLVGRFSSMVIIDDAYEPIAWPPDETRLALPDVVGPPPDADQRTNDPQQ